MSDESSEQQPNVTFWMELPEAERQELESDPRKARDWYDEMYRKEANRASVITPDVSVTTAAVFSIAAELCSCEYVWLTELFAVCRKRGFSFVEVSGALQDLAQADECLFVVAQGGSVKVGLYRMSPVLERLTVEQAIAESARELEYQTA